jgi:hypothetical protein
MGNEKSTAEMAAALYQPSPTMKQTYQEKADEVHDVLGLTVTERRAREEAHTKLVADVGFEPYVEGKLLYDEFVAAEVADARGEEEPDAAQVQAWNEETLRELRETYGQQEAEKLLARTKAFVAAAPPRLREILGTRHLGSKPEIVKSLVSHVRASNYRPKKGQR